MLRRILFPSLLLSLVLLFACGDDESGTSVTSIRTIVRPTVDIVEVGEELSLSAVDQNGTDITESVTFVVNDTNIEGATYTPAQAGALSIFATYEGISSTITIINVINSIESITIDSDKESIRPTGNDAATITAKDQTGYDITEFVNFYKNGELNKEGNLISSDQQEILKVTAKYGDVTSNELNINSSLSITSLKIEVDQENIPADAYTKAKFTVRNQTNDDVTKFITLFVNGQEMESDVFTSDTEGSFTFQAKYEDLQSEMLAVQVDPFTVRKVLIEEFTGEWCGWCPEAAYNLDELAKEHPYVLTVGIHNGDGLEYNNEAIIRDAFGINGFPGGLVGRVNLPGAGYNSQPMSPSITNEYNRQIYDETVMAGVEISSEISGSDLDIDVSVQFYEQVNEEVLVTIYIIENNVVGGTQQNYFSNNTGFENYYYYPKPALLQNYVHQYVLRTAATDILGEKIPEESATKGNRYSLPTKTVDIGDFDNNETYIIAFVHYPMSGGKIILNAQQVKAGSSIGIDK